MKEKKRYTFGYSDPRAVYDPTRWEQPPEPPKKEEGKTSAMAFYLWVTMVVLKFSPMPMLYVFAAQTLVT